MRPQEMSTGCDWLMWLKWKRHVVMIETTNGLFGSNEDG